MRVSRSLFPALLLALTAGLAAPAPVSAAQATARAGTANVAAAAQAPRVGVFEIEDSLEELPSPFAFPGMEPDVTFRRVVAALRDASRDTLDALVLRLKDAALNTTQVEELGAAIRAARNNGVRVSVFAENYGPAELLLASFADEALIQSGGGVSLPGLYMEEMFLADTLAWIGVKAEMIQIGDYKGAAEQMSNSKPSPQWDQNISALLDSMYENQRSILKAGREMDDAELDRAMETAWFADADQAQAAGLIDAQLELPALASHLAKAMGRPASGDTPVTWVANPLGLDAADRADMSNPFAFLRLLSEKPDHTPTRPTIAVLHINGAIVDGESGSGGLLSGGSTVGSRTIARAAEDLREQDLVKGVILRIDSPGGSAIASEMMWRAIRRLAETKPVWVSVGSMAASGGYYAAMAGDRIYVNPSSIVGSIGVVGGKYDLSEAMKELRVNVVPRARGPRAAMFRSVGAWTTDEAALVREQMQRTYDLFTRRVAERRVGIDLSKTAEGRLFTGDRALALNMADKLGGLDTAIADMADSLDLTDPAVMDWPAPRPFEEVIEEMLSGFTASAPGVSNNNNAGPLDAALARAVLSLPAHLIGPRAWAQVRTALDGALQLRSERVLLMNPRVLIFH
jgi:protease-4